MSKKNQKQINAKDVAHVFTEAMAVSEDFSDQINPEANILLPVASIIAAMSCPEQLGLSRSYTKEELLTAISKYAATLDDCPMKYRYRNYNFFGKRYFENYLDQQEDSENKLTTKTNEGIVQG